jgi:hypothetical protein
MCPEKAQNSYSAFPALDAAVGFSRDFEDVISFDFSQSLKSCIAPRNLEITLAETDKVAMQNLILESVDSLPKLPPADEEGRVRIWSSYSNCLDPEKEVPWRQDGIGDLRSWI